MLRYAVITIATLVGLAVVTPETFAQDRAPAAPRARTSPAKKVVKAKPAPVHKIAIQVSENNPAVMGVALNNAANVVAHYAAKGEKVLIEIVAYGPGLHMFRDDTSPLKQRISAMSLQTPEITFAACANTHANMTRQEGKEIKLISEAKVTPSGVVRLSELQRQGYSYIRP